MAIAAAERHMKRREKLKTQELYEQLKTNNAGVSPFVKESRNG